MIFTSCLYIKYKKYTLRRKKVYARFFFLNFAKKLCKKLFINYILSYVNFNDIHMFYL